MKTIFTLLLCLAITPFYAQNTLQGRVIDSTTQQPITFANVYIPKLEKGVVTEDSGDFTIKDLPSGNYNLLVSYVGYQTKSINISIPNQKSLKIALTPSAIEMEEVIISTPFHKLQKDNVMKVERASVTELKSQGAVTLADGISNIAGVESVTTGLGVGKPVIRGLSSNRVLVYTQGVRLENQQFGDEHGLGINSAGVESVEVIKGPASLLYGSDALGGVLYLNPERFAEANTSKADISSNYFSNTEGYSTDLGYKTSMDNVKLLFRANASGHSDYNTKDYRVTNSRFNTKDFKSGIGYQKGDFKTEFRYNLNQSKIGIPEDIGIQTLEKTPRTPFQDITSHIFSSKSSLFFNGSSLNLTLGYTYNDRQEFEDYVAPALHMKLKTANYDLKYNLPNWGKFETIVGIQGMNQINKNYGEETLIPDATTNDFGVFGMSHIHFKTTDFQVGIRYDNRNIEVPSAQNTHFSSFNGAIGFKQDLGQNMTARFNFASGFRAPNLSELYSDGVHEGTNRYEVGNSDLSYEQNLQSDVALEYANQHIEIFANGFYNRINNYIYLSPDGTVRENSPVYNYAQNDAKLFGGEAGFHLHPHPLDWLHLESSFETVTGELNAGGYLPLIPANKWSNTIRVEFSKNWLNNGYAFFKVQSYFKQSKVSQFETPTPGYDLLSLGFGGTLKLFNKDLSVTISGTNLTNKTYINHLSRLKPDGIFNMGRNLNIGFTYQL